MIVRLNSMQAKQLKKMGLLQLFCKITTQKGGFGTKSCAADKQECVFRPLVVIILETE